MTDEYFELKKQKDKFKMSMRRNILRRTLSEDLDWAHCLQADPNLISFHMFPINGGGRTTGAHNDNNIF